MMLSGRAFDLGPTLVTYRARQVFVAKDFADLQRRYGVTVVEPASILCASGRCAVADGGRPLYRDHHHLSAFGAAHLARLFAKVL
jgi:hypothetical protein